MATSTDYQIIPVTEDPSQTLQVTLGTQVCTINIYAKSIFVPVSPPGAIPTTPPEYERANPVFLDLLVNDVLIIGGVLCQNANRIVRNAYLGFVGDLAFYDLQGTEDPTGLPPPRTTETVLPNGSSGNIPGLGSRFILTYWPDL